MQVEMVEVVEVEEVEEAVEVVVEAFAGAASPAWSPRLQISSR